MREGTAIRPMADRDDILRWIGAITLVVVGMVALIFLG